jgi:flagellin-like hook-associated protein FlgL
MSVSSISSADSLAAIHNMQAAGRSLSKTMTQLSTGQAINSGADDPAGLIARETMRADLTGLHAAQKNASYANNMLSVADAGMMEINGILNDVEGLLVGSVGLSGPALEANQMQIDQALESINFIRNTTGFNGVKLLDGSNNPHTFALSPDVTRTTSVDLPNVSTAELGKEDGRLSQLATGQDYDLASGNIGPAQEIVHAAREQMLLKQAEIGTTQKYAIETGQRVLEDMTVATTRSVSMFDTDFAKATSEMAKGEIILRAAAATLAQQNSNMKWTTSLLGNVAPLSN